MFPSLASGREDWRPTKEMSSEGLSARQYAPPYPCSRYYPCIMETGGDGVCRGRWWEVTSIHDVTRGAPHTEHEEPCDPDAHRRRLDRPQGVVCAAAEWLGGNQQ